MKHSRKLAIVIVQLVLFQVQWLSQLTSWQSLHRHSDSEETITLRSSICKMFGLLYDSDDGDEAGAGSDDEALALAADDADDTGDAAPPRRGHRRGERLQPETILKMKLGHEKNKVRRAKAVAAGLANLLDSNCSNHVNRTVFSHGNPSNHQVVLLGNGRTVEIPKDKHGSRSSDLRMCRDYGVTSAALAQADGIAEFIKGDAVRHIVDVGTFDDAAIWVKDPATALQRYMGERSEGTHIDGKLWRRGKHIHLSCCNSTEHIYVRRDVEDFNLNGSCVYGCEVHSPTRMLVEANAATVRERWKRWVALSPNGAGHAIDQERKIQTSVNQSNAATCYVVTKDNLGLNLCIIGQEEKVIIDGLANGTQDEASSDTYLHLNCCCHSAVLSTKPVVERLGDMPGKCCRMGHLHESGKTSRDHDKLVEKHVTAKFRFVAVGDMPEELKQWRVAAVKVLKHTRCVLGLTPAEEDFILGVDNGNWDEELFSHFCLGPDRCLAGCGGNPETACNLMVKSTRLSIGAVEQAPLKYRWKGMERFIGKLYRSQRQHNLWYHTHLELFPLWKVNKAKLELERLIAADDGADTNKTSQKRQVRGGQTVEFLESDQRGLRTERAMVLNVGIQGYLNTSFASDTAVTKYSAALSMLPPSSTGPASTELAKLRADAIRRNKSLVDGSTASAMLAVYSKYSYFDGEVWSDWRLNADGRFATCLDLIVVMEDLFYRLIFNMDQPKFNIFDVCSVDEGEAFDYELVQTIARRIQAKTDRCEDCVDKVFTKIWCWRLLESGRSGARDAHAHLCDILAVLRNTSATCEMKHLVSPEIRVSRRGPTCSATTSAQWCSKRACNKQLTGFVQRQTRDVLAMPPLHRISSIA